jgi:hypothetical protein
MACLLAPPALAESAVVDTYNKYLTEQSVDYGKLADLDDANWAILSKYQDTSEVSAFERGVLEINATEMLALIEKMRARGRKAFGDIERPYEVFCVHSTTMLLQCAEYRTYYKLMITETIILGADFHSFTESSIFILTALDD